MRLTLGIVCALAAVATVGSGSGLAQPPVPGARGPETRPPFSPYLNLARPGASSAVNYYGLVRPQLQFRQAVQNLQSDVTANQQAIGGLHSGAGGMPGTGHPTVFLNYGNYFLNSGPAAGQGARLGPRPAGMGAPAPRNSARMPRR